MKPGPELPLRAAARLSVWASFIPPTPCCVNAHILLLPAPERRNGTMEDKKKNSSYRWPAGSAKLPDLEGMCFWETMRKTKTSWCDFKDFSYLLSHIPDIHESGCSIVEMKCDFTGKRNKEEAFLHLYIPGNSVLTTYTITICWSLFHLHMTLSHRQNSSFITFPASNWTKW